MAHQPDFEDPSINHFEHKRLDLDSDKDSFRLLKILEGEDGNLIECEMKNTTMGAEPYACLSYTWHPENPGHPVKINGRATTVGDNLWKFLYAARSAKKDQWLWIDALCIDQENNSEKTHQVNKMGEIYGGAKSVLIWLGLMDSFAGSDPRSQKHEQHASKTSRTTNHPNFITPFWSRAWIAQEVLLANDAAIFLRTNTISLNELAKLSATDWSQWFNDNYDAVRLFASESNFEGPHEAAEELSGSKYMISDMEWNTFEGFVKALRGLPGSKYVFPKLRLKWKATRRVSLAALLPHFASSGCKDERDRVYALLSLANDGYRLKAEYDISREDLFQNTLEILMKDITVNELLLAGQILIQALRLKPPSGNVSENPPQIDRKTSRAVTPPMWWNAVLEKADPSGGFSQITILCMYVVVFDASNIHIFEYAMEKDKSVIKYSWAHKYLRGAPPRYESIFDRERYFCFDQPSKNVYYFVKRNIEIDELRSWSAPQFQIFNAGLSTSTDLSPRLWPARRWLNQKGTYEAKLWGVYSTIMEARNFTSVKKAIKEHRIYHARHGPELNPQTARSILVSLDT